MKSRLILCLFLGFQSLFGSQAAFEVVVLGAHGGPKENNLSGYLLASKGSDGFVALDAGSLLHGIDLAAKKNNFDHIKVDAKSLWNFEAEILRQHIKGYLLSHAHLDHVAGLVINSTIDSNKPIFGIDSTIDCLRDYLFNWKIWPNFGSEGPKPLNLYRYQRMRLGEKISIPNTQMTVEPFLLNHPESSQSTAFLIESGGSYVLYFGDTSPDDLEPQKRMEIIWKRVAPLIQEKKLKCIFLECSYTDERQKRELFGHLNAKYLIEELKKLALLVDPINPSLNDLRIVVTHIKESFLKEVSSQKIIESELTQLNSLGIEFIFPKQGERLKF
jgi:3',5'-cyclic-nucleotide phosphodiesterase